MQIEDRLDALLTMRLDGAQQPPDAWTASDDELLPLLQAADALAPLRETRPSAEFARSLEARLLTYAASRAAGAEPSAHAGDAAERLLSDVPSSTLSAEPGGPGYARRPRSGRVWRPWQHMAAAVLLFVVGAAALTTVAASAGPDSPLFGLHRAEQSMRVQLAASQGDRVRLHLSYADEALAQLDSAIARRAGDPAYSNALAAFLTEQRAAAVDLAAMPADSERDALSTQLAVLRSKARSDLRASLHAVGWPDRLAATRALGELGETVLVVRDVKVTRMDGQNVHLIRLVVSGSGFAPGAIVVLGGLPVGAITVAIATQMVVEIDATTLHLPLRDIGVSNPDGTAALSPRVEVDNSANQGGGNTRHPTPAVDVTPTPRGRHGGGGAGG